MLLNVYEMGRLTLFHLDAYRVGGADDFEGIGFSELLEQGGVVVVEWASRAWPGCCRPATSASKSSTSACMTDKSQLTKCKPRRDYKYSRNFECSCERGYAYRLQWLGRVGFPEDK